MFAISMEAILGPQTATARPQTVRTVILSPKVSARAWQEIEKDRIQIRSSVTAAVSTCWDEKAQKPTCSALTIAVSKGLLNLVPAELVADLQTRGLQSLLDAGMPPALLAATVLSSPSYPSPREYREMLPELQCKDINTCHTVQQFEAFSRLTNSFGFAIDSYWASDVYSSFQSRAPSLLTDPIGVRLDEERLRRFETTYNDPAFAALRSDAMRRFQWITRLQSERSGKEIGITVGSGVLFAGLLWGSEALLPVLLPSLALDETVVTIGGVEVTRMTLLAPAIASLVAAPAQVWARAAWIEGLRGEALRSYIGRYTPATMLTYYVTSLAGGYLFSYLGRDAAGEIIAASSRSPGNIIKVDFTASGRFAAVAARGEAGTTPTNVLPGDFTPSVLRASEEVEGNTVRIYVPVEDLASQAASGTAESDFLGQLAGAGIGAIVIDLSGLPERTSPSVLTMHVPKMIPASHTTVEIPKPKPRTTGFAGSSEELARRYEEQPRRRLPVGASHAADPAVVRSAGSDPTPPTEKAAAAAARRRDRIEYDDLVDTGLLDPTQTGMDFEAWRRGGKQRPAVNVLEKVLSRASADVVAKYKTLESLQAELESRYAKASSICHDFARHPSNISAVTALLNERKEETVMRVRTENGVRILKLSEATSQAEPAVVLQDFLSELGVAPKVYAVLYGEELERAREVMVRDLPQEGRDFRNFKIGVLMEEIPDAWTFQGRQRLPEYAKAWKYQEIRKGIGHLSMVVANLGLIPDPQIMITRRGDVYLLDFDDCEYAGQWRQSRPDVWRTLMEYSKKPILMYLIELSRDTYAPEGNTVFRFLYPGRRIRIGLSKPET